MSGGMDFIKRVLQRDKQYYSDNSTEESQEEKHMGMDFIKKTLEDSGYTRKKSVPELKQSFENDTPYGKFKDSSFSKDEMMKPVYEHRQEEREKHNATSEEFKQKYGMELSEFNQDAYYKWATEHGFKFMHTENAGLTENPRNSLFSKHTEEEKQEEKRLRYLLQYNNRRKELEKTNTAKAFQAGIRDSITFNTFKRLEDWADKKDIDSSSGKYVDALNDKYKVMSTDIEEKAQKEHPVASGIGVMTGELAKLGAFQNIAGKAVDSVKWLSSKPEWIVSAVKSGLAFGLKDAANATGAGEDVADIVKSGGISAIGGAVGGAASHGIGELGENLLFKTGLQNKIIPEIARNAVSSATFAAGDTASTYFLYPQEERPTVGEIAQNIGVSFAFGAITTALNTAKLKNQSKEALNYVNDKMIADYERMVKAANAKDPESVKKFAKNVIDYSDAMERYLKGEGFKIAEDAKTSSDTVKQYLTGKGVKGAGDGKDTAVLKKARFVGEDARVKNIQEDLTTIRSRAKNLVEKAENFDAKSTSANATNTEAIKAPLAEKTGTTGTSVSNQDMQPEIQQNAPNNTTDILDGTIQSTAKVQEAQASPQMVQHYEPTKVDAIDVKESVPDIKSTDVENEASITENIVPVQQDVPLEQQEQESPLDSSIQSLTNTIASHMDETHIGAPPDTAHMMETNTKFLSDGNNLFDKDFVARYANDFVAGMANKNSNAYQKLSAVTDDIASELTNYAITGESELSDSKEFKVTAKAFSNIVIDAVKKNAVLHNNLYGENDVLNAQVNDIKNGNLNVMNISEKTGSIENQPEQDIRYIRDENETPGFIQSSTYERDYADKLSNVHYITSLYKLDQKNIDYAVKKQHKGEYATLKRNGAIEIKNGLIYGKFAASKMDSGGYGITYLPIGIAVDKFNTQREAVKFMKEMDKQTENIDLNLWHFNGKYDLYQDSDGMLKQFMDTVNTVKENIQDKPESTIQSIVLPVQSKTELVSYMNQHIGGKVRVTYPTTGASEMRTLKSVNKNGYVTVKEDGSEVRGKLIANELEYGENGFTIKKADSNKPIAIIDFVGGEKNSKMNTSEVDKIAQKEEKNIEKPSGNDIIGSSKADGDTKAQGLSDFVKNKIASGEKFTSNTLFKEANAVYGGTLADNTFTVKDAYDAMELGVNQYILSHKGDLNLQELLELSNKLPTQTKRTEGTDKFQQFSTPPAIAYLANYAANISNKDIMLEPSAGIGGLATFAKREGAKVVVNELDRRRLSILKNMPFDSFYNEDAEQINNILGGELEPTVIVMNPPFSSSSERNIKSSKIGAKHIEEALKILAPNGRLVAITGKTMADDAPAFRTWWEDIKSKYNVVANIGIDGKNYNKYGTNFGIQLLVIDKNGATTNTKTAHVENLNDLYDILGGIRDERSAISGTGEPKQQDGSREGISEPGGIRTGKTEKVQEGFENRQREDTSIQQAETTPTRKEASNSEKLQRERTNVVSGSGSNEAVGKSRIQRNAVQPRQKNVQRSDGGNRATTANEQFKTNVLDDAHADVQRGGALENKDAGGNSDIVDGEYSSGIQRNREHRTRVKKKELTDSIFEQYKTQPLKLKGVKPHPAKISESAAMSAITPPKVTYKPMIPDNIINAGVLSDVQLEAVTYAGQSNKQTLPDGSARGFFLGDGTGVGKGRTITGIILDNYMQGRKKSIWMSLNTSLVNDMKRDVKALFGNSDIVHEFKGGKNADKSLTFQDGILAVSYSALSTGWDKVDSNLQKIINWLGKDFDGVIVFDEAHKMANSGKKGVRGAIKPSNIALSGIELQRKVPKAKIIYSSATGATEVENLRYAERLGLWGEGTSFINSDDFVNKIKAGGLAAMELIARDMKAMGVYLSRNISYDDVKYDRITHKLTKDQRKIYDELARSWQIVFQNVSTALKTTNQSNDGMAKSRAIGSFWSSQQRFFNQILTAMQVPSVIKDIEKQLEAGNSCVIQLVSTNEASDKKEFERLKEFDLDLDEFDTTPRQMLMSYIENCFPVQQYEKYRDDEGHTRSKPVYDSSGNQVVNREAVKQKEDLLNKLGSIKVPSSPIDMIINHFGEDIVAENTGRSRRVSEKNGKRTEVKLSGKKDADVDAFQDGQKRIIIFSKAGGTGKSYHADLSAKNQQHRVHYLLEPGWRADDAVQGFGRSHRSNQVSAPTFKLVTTDLKGQMRFVSTIAKRLDQLGALTKGQRQAGSQGMFSASDNLENGFAADVLAVFYKDLLLNRVEGISNGRDIIEKLGLKEKILDSTGALIRTASELREVNKFLNRILCLDSKEQNTVFEGYSAMLEEATESAAQAGTLDKGLENYKADKISVNESKDIHVDKSTGAATKYYNLTAQNKVAPTEISELPTDSSNFMGYYTNKNTGAIRAVFKSASKTDQYGRIIENIKMYTQMKQKNGRPKCEYRPLTSINKNWQKVKDVAEAEKLWNDAIAKLPEYTTENIHLIGGVVLPVWNKLPTENVRIYRMLTDKGDMLIGRVIPENMIDETLKRMGVGRKKEKINSADLIQHINDGDIAHLENGWRIKQSRVANEQRIEIVGPAYENMNILKDKGVFSERINFATRFFIPTNSDTSKILDAVLNISAIERIENPDLEKYNRGGDSDVRWGGSSGDFKNIVPYTEKEKNDWKNSKRINIYEDNEQFDSFIDDALSKKNLGQKIYFGRMTDEIVEKIHSETGFDVTAFNVCIRADEIRKILLHSHGDAKSEELRGQIAITKEDILKIPEIVSTFDSVKLSDRLFENKPVLEFEKNINGKNFVATYISGKHKDLTVQTMYKSKKNKPPTAADVQAPAFTPETISGTASIDSISQDTKKSNGIVKENRSTRTGAWNKESKSQKTIPLHDIVYFLSESFGIPISVGNLRNNRALGEHNELSRSIRIKIANDLPTITHELGHRMDKKYGLRKMPSIDEALEFASHNHPTLMSLYKDKDKPGEAVAEFIREYLKNPKKAEKSAPEFYREFIEAISKEDSEALKQASKYIQDYFDSDFSDKVSAAMTTNKEIKKAEKRSLSEVAKKVYTRIVDDFAPINDVMKYVEAETGTQHRGSNNAYTMAINSRNTDAITSFVLRTGMADSNGNMIDGDSFVDCIAEINPKEIKDFDKYLVLKHSIEWIKPKDGKTKRVFADETLQDADRIQEEINKYEKDHPEYKRSAENLYQYQRNILKLWAVDTGGMSEELFNTLQERYPNYVPFKRYTSRKEGGYKSSFANQHTPISRAKGSGATIISPLESIMKNTKKFINFGVKNKVMGTLAQYVGTIEGFAQFMEEVPPDKIRNSITITPQVERLKNAMSGLENDDFMELSDAMDSIFGDQVISYTPVAIAGKQIVTYMDQGKYRYFQINDKPLYESIVNLAPAQVGEFTRIATKILAATNLLITQFNPLFGLKNPIRDFDTAMKHSKAYDNPAKFVAAYAVALKHIISNSKEYKMYQAAGGGHMSNFSDNIDAISKTLHDIAIKDMGNARKLAYSIFIHPIESLTRLNEITETIPRLAEFEGMLKKGADNQEAAYEAADVTVNFNKSGKLGRSINRISRFSNAAVQGVDKEARIFTTGGKKSIAKYIIRYAISAILTAALLEFWNRNIDDDGWEELSSYQKNNFYCIGTGDGKFIKIPKAREAAIPNTALERAMDYSFDDKDAFYQFGEYIGDTMLPSWLPLTGLAEGGIDEAMHQAAGSTVLGGFVDNMVNADFKGTPIVPASMEDTPKKQQTNDKTTWIAYAIGQLMDESPLKIDHLIDNYTGIIGKLNRAYGTMDPSQIDISGGFKNTFSADSAYSTDVFNKIYEGRDKQKEKFQNESTPQNAGIYEKYAITASYITKINKLIKALPVDKQREARQSLIDDIKNTRMDMTESDKIIIKSFKDNIDDEYFLKSMPSEKISYTKKGHTYEYTMDYSEYQSYIKDYRAELEKQRLKAIGKGAYSSASDAEKVEIIKEANSEAAKRIKEEYAKKLAAKFIKKEN